ncbi:hypothetical protein M9458_014859, partial [Cirrhinus mrigala]
VFPVYMNSLLKTSALVGSTELSTDDRAFHRFFVNSMGVEETQVLLYPRLIPLHSMDVSSEAIPAPVRCSEERLNESGMFLLENGPVPPTSSRTSSMCPLSATCPQKG